MNKIKNRTHKTILAEITASVKPQLTDIKNILENLIEGHWLRASRLHILYSKIRIKNATRELAEIYKHPVDKSFVVSIIYEIFLNNNYDISKSTIMSDINTIDFITPKFIGLYNKVPITHVKMVIMSHDLNNSKKESLLRKMIKDPMTRDKLLIELGISSHKDPHISKVMGYKTILKKKDAKTAEGIMRAGFKLWLATRDSPLGSLVFDDGDETWEVSESNPFPR